MPRIPEKRPAPARQASREDAIPPMLRPFRFHGLGLPARIDGSENVYADCPFCEREGKLGIVVDTGLWHCIVCHAKGNTATFLRQLWDLGDKQTTDYKGLASFRKLLYPETLMHWGACISPLSGDWLVPGHGYGGKLDVLYRYARDFDDPERKRRVLKVTAGCEHQLCGVKLYDRKKPNLLLCEGAWDGMAAWEVVRFVKESNSQYILTGSESESLYASTNVLAIPGANIWHDSWAPFFAGKNVLLAFDNDHPRVLKSGTLMDGAGIAGVKRLSSILAKLDQPPESIKYLAWGPEGYDSSVPHGYDVRDCLTVSDKIPDRVEAWGSLMERVEPIPAEWLPGRSRLSQKTGGVGMELLECESWGKLTNAWSLALKWTEGLDRTFAVMLSSVLSTMQQGEQLWFKVLGPPSCGKSTLCEALSVNKRYILAKSTISGMHSGMSDHAGEEDCSMMPLIQNKTFIVKDGDTLLKAPNKEKILAELRDIYDRVSRTKYGNRVNRDYEGLNMTLLICGTEDLRELDTSSLGARFLDCIVARTMEEDLKREIARRVAFRSDRDILLLANGKPETRDSPEMSEVKRLTGGYVDWLRQNSSELLMAVKEPSGEQEIDQLVDLGEFIAYMRAQPSEVSDSGQVEMPFRLTAQVTRLSRCLSVVLNSFHRSEEVMRITKQVSLDTSEGKSQEVVRLLFREGGPGCSVGGMAVMLGEGDGACRSWLNFLADIGVAEKFIKGGSGGPGGRRVFYRLTEKMRTLWRNVMGG